MKPIKKHLLATSNQHLLSSRKKLTLFAGDQKKQWDVLKKTGCIATLLACLPSFVMADLALYFGYDLVELWYPNTSAQRTDSTVQAALSPHFDAMVADQPMTTGETHRLGYRLNQPRHINSATSAPASI